MKQLHYVCVRGSLFAQAKDKPAKPENRLKVRGILVLGLTSIRTFLSVCTYNRTFPALFSGLSNTAISSYPPSQTDIIKTRDLLDALYQDESMLDPCYVFS